MLVDDPEHLRAGEVLEARPAQVRIRLIALILALRKDDPLDRFAQRDGFASEPGFEPLRTRLDVLPNSPFTVTIPSWTE
jgi:hypothetical protein